MKVVMTESFKKDVSKMGLGDIGYNMKWWEHVTWPIERVLEKITDVPRNIKWFWQRGTRGYADCDWWDLDHYLAGWLPKALKDFRTKGISSHPVGVKGRKEWVAILKKMEKGFGNFERLSDIFFHPKNKREEKWMKDYKEGLRLFSKHFYNLWD